MATKLKSIHVGDEGTNIILPVKAEGVAVDLSSAILLEMIFKKPSGETLTVTAVHDTDGTDGRMRYTIQDELDEEGEWQVQGVVQLSDGSWHTTVVAFYAEANLV